MATKKQQTHAKRARELAVKERRERKRVKKAERAIAAQGAPETSDDGGALPELPGAELPGAELPADESAAGPAPEAR